MRVYQGSYRHGRGTLWVRIERWPRTRELWARVSGVSGRVAPDDGRTLAELVWGSFADAVRELDRRERSGW